MDEDQGTYILTVCTGNICRSPMAEGIIKKILADRHAIHISSAGTNAVENNPPTEFALIVSREKGVDISDHKAKRLEPLIIRASTFILCMEQSHIEQVLTLDVSATGKVYNLADFSGESEKLRHIADPYGCGVPEYRECFRSLNECINNFLVTGPGKRLKDA